MSKKPFTNEPVRDARTLGAGKMLILGLQHMFAMFGATVLVPIITGLSVQVTLMCAGLGTLFFHFCTKFKVPAFLGSSFVFLGGFTAVQMLDSGIYANMTEAEKLPYACGGIVVAGLLYLVMAAVVKFVGIKRVMRFLPPIVTGPIIILIGLILAGTAVTNASANWWLAALSIIVIVICNMWGKGMIKIIPILMGVLIPYVVALCCGLVDFTAVKDARFIGLPPFQLAKFDISAILIMAPIAIASMMEHIGDMSSISATCGENYIEDPGMHRSLIGDGLATTFAALFGGPANTTYG
ncbi:MAG: uracil-xanthine permease, partial [Oscillospiraceae bacterium]|nr:uracil-xanthine permease [Oscillospiraceae bacterium]